MRNEIVAEVIAERRSVSHPELDMALKGDSRKSEKEKKTSNRGEKQRTSQAKKA